MHTRNFHLLNASIKWQRLCFHSSPDVWPIGHQTNGSSGDEELVFNFIAEDKKTNLVPRVLSPQIKPWERGWTKTLTAELLLSIFACLTLRFQHTCPIPICKMSDGKIKRPLDIQFVKWTSNFQLDFCVPPFNLTERNLSSRATSSLVCLLLLYGYPLEMKSYPILSHLYQNSYNFIKR